MFQVNLILEQESADTESEKKEMFIVLFVV